MSPSLPSTAILKVLSHLKETSLTTGSATGDTYHLVTGQISGQCATFEIYPLENPWPAN